jgi:hypothetical protein
MRRGTTPIHRFTLPVKSEEISKIRVLYAQNSKVILTKQDDVVFEGGKAVVHLTQEDTLLFKSSSIAEIQLRIITTDGNALASNVLTVRVKRLLEDEVFM